MREDWADKLKQKLEGHSKTPPTGLWEGISKQMEAFSVPIQLGRRNWRWYGAAAAVILLLVGIFVFQEKENQPPLQAENTSLEPATQQTEIIDSVRGDKEPVPTPQQRKEKLIAHQHSHPSLSVGSKRPVEQETELKPTETTIEEEAVAQVTSESEPAPEQEPQPQKEQSLQVLPDEWVAEQISSASTKKKKWSIGVGASGGLLAAQTNKDTSGAWAELSDPKHDNPDEPNENLTRATRSKNYAGIYNPKYHLPIRISVNLNYPLTSHLDLFSGINYTYLHTTYDIDDKPNEFYEQKLHYLGVPLGLSWRLWSNRHLRFYVTGRALIEKCLNEKPWQFSAGGSLGAEYNITPQFGFYVEPSLGYYFKDGTSLEHYYKDNPLIFSLEFGLRLHLSK